MAPPPGVLAQFEFFNAGDRPCIREEATEPTIRPLIEQYHVLGWAVLCLVHFNFDGPIEVVVSDPAGGVTALHYPRDIDPPLPGDDSTFVEVFLDLWAPEGVYSASATQFDTVATTTFGVGQPSNPIVRVVPPTTGSPGQGFHLQLAGFPPNGVAHVDVYRPVDGHNFTYVTTVDVAGTDGRGRAEHVLTTTSADPPGEYCFIGRGAPGACFPQRNELWLE